MKAFSRWLACCLIMLSVIGTLPALAQTEYSYGDPNGDGSVSAEDALLILQVTVGKKTFDNDSSALAADVSGDYFTANQRIVGATDALLVLQYTVGKIQSFPVHSLDPLMPAALPTFHADGILTPGKEVDFVVDIPAGRDIRILQLSDLQSTQLDADEICRDKRYKAPYRTDAQSLLWRYVDEAVTTTQPDLIVLGGDNVQGIFDDNGRDWLTLCEHMDSFEVPWTVVFGNHDRESLFGVDLQVQYLKNSRYCLFASQPVSGTSNYTVAVRQGNVYRYVLWMVDTHGSDSQWSAEHPDIISEKGVRLDQLWWMKNTAAAITHDLGQPLPSLVFMHIAPKQVANLVKKKYPDEYNQFPFTPYLDGDFGVATEKIGGVGSDWMLDVAKEIGCTGMFFGHQHRVAFSMTLRGIRMTWGLKTGNYAYHDKGLNGGVLITIPQTGPSFSVEYRYSQIFD